MVLKAEQIFINLPVKDLEVSMDFFKKIGFEFDERFTDEKAACIILGSNMYAMLLEENFFKSFTNLSIADTTKENECILAFNVSSTEEVDTIFNKAREA